MSAIFISHSSHDDAIADQVKSRLEKQGYSSIFLDFDPEYGIPSGRNWQKELYMKLRACQAAIVLCSKQSIESNWCFAEITQALALGKPVIAVKVAPCTIWNHLKSGQTVDLTVDPEGGYARLWRGLIENQLDPARVFYWNRLQPPFPGLRAFEEKDAAVFFGRDDETRRLIETIRSLRDFSDSKFLLVSGASGVGKSSLVRARLLP